MANNTTYQFRVQFLDVAGVPVTGLVPTIKVTETDTNVVIINGDFMVEIADGWYKYDWTYRRTSEQYVWHADANSGTATPRTIGGILERLTHQAVLQIELNAPTVIDLFSIRSLEPVEILCRIWDTSGNIVDFFDAGAETDVGLGTGAGIFIYRGSELIKTVSIFPLSVRVQTYQVEYFFNTTIFKDLDVLPGDAILLGFSGLKVTFQGKTYGMPGPATVLSMVERHYSAVSRVVAGSTTSLIRTNIIADDGAFDGMQLSVCRENTPEADFMITRNIVSYVKDGGDGVFTLDSPLPFVPSDAYDQVYITVAKESVGNKISLMDALARQLGLAHENIYVTNTFDIDGKHTASQLQVYDTKANALVHDGVTGLVVKYDLAVTYLTGRPTAYVQTKEDGT